MTARAPGRSPLDGGAACLLVVGAPGAGKSTVTRLVAGRLSRAALLEGDTVSRLVVSGRVWALGEPADEADRQTRLTNDNLVALAASFADAGFTPVIDWVVPDRAQLDLYVAGLGDRGLALVVLDPGGDVCRHRNELRDPEEQFDFDGQEALVATMRRGFGEVGWWFDTSALTPEETAEQVLAHAYALGRRGL
ncbi:AAA family ATPase [Terracoccus sp. 273MFTsu3.1]|uniref:AAA family ATPase n=1 Tax=Terracoccus sp. 273MFTsu3.1 TaxID=1172188 RepID=UPI00035E8C27|nr:AAA family ATPase [Terracoccus sp. 273MFTsu3.1]